MDVPDIGSYSVAFCPISTSLLFIQVRIIVSSRRADYLVMPRLKGDFPVGVAASSGRLPGYSRSKKSARSLLRIVHAQAEAARS